MDLGARSRSPEARTREHLAVRIAAFVITLGLIVVATHFVGGAAGRWSEVQGGSREQVSRSAGVRMRDSGVPTGEMTTNEMKARLALWQSQVAELEAAGAGNGYRATLDSRRCLEDLKAQCALMQAHLDEASGGRR